MNSVTYFLNFKIKCKIPFVSFTGDNGCILIGLGVFDDSLIFAFSCTSA